MSLRYAHEKLSSAVLTLSQSTESLQNRLAAAYTNGLMLIGLELQGDLPEDLQPLYRSIRVRLTSGATQSEGQGSVIASTRTMSDAEARGIIADIVLLLSEVAQRLGTPSQGVRGGSDE